MSEEEWGLVCPFWIDTPAYAQRDKEMFVAGFEFARLLEHIRHSDDALETTIHRENESRVRLACARFGRTCRIEQCEPEHDPQEMWAYLTIEARSGEVSS